MKVRLLLLVSVVILSAFSDNLLAQKGNNPLFPIEQGSPIYIGPVLGYNRVMHSAQLASFSNDILCPYFENGSANGFFAGLSFEYLLGDPLQSISSIIGRVLYNTFPANFNKAGRENENNGYPSYIEDAQGNKTIIYSKTEHNIEVTYSVITAEVMYKLNLFNTNFGVTLGPTFDFPMTKKFYQDM
ncbi:MAG: hypothetical protein QG635_2317 [Bacteroidota bacterium]|nr:hypothetical protein [Bacteroidota bacterium]